MSHNNRQSQEKFTNIQQFTNQVLDKICPNKSVKVNDSTKTNDQIIQYKQKNIPLKLQALVSYLEGGHSCPKRRAFVNVVIAQINYFKGRYINSIENIAKAAGCSYWYAQQMLTELEQLGVIRIRHQFNSANIYTLNPEMNNEDIVRQCHPWLIGLRSFMSLVLLLSVIPGSSFFSSVKAFSAKAQPIFENVLLNNSNSRNIDTNVQKRQSEIVNHCTNLDNKELLAQSYPYLESRMSRALVVLLGLTPSKGAWLAQVPDKILRDAYTDAVYMLTLGKVNPRNRAKYVAGIVHNHLKENDIAINYSLISATVEAYGLDSSWTQFSVSEKSRFEQSIVHIADRLVFELKKIQFSNTNKEEHQKKELQKKIEAARKNPYSPYYTGDPYTQSSPLRKEKESSLSNPPIPPTPHQQKETKLVNDCPALAPVLTSQEQCAIDITNYRTGLSKTLPFMYDMMKTNFTNILKEKYSFLPSDFDILTY